MLLGIATPYPGDESRFIETSKLFGRGLTLDLLRHYPEMSGPLPFALFGWWGAAFGYSLAAMRVCALAIGCASLLMLYVFWRSVVEARLAVLAGVGLCLNPYMATMSLFVYTDMPALLCGLAALAAGLRGWAGAMGLALAAAMLCRQYMLFLAAGLAAYFAFQRQWRSASACTAALIPLAALMALWGGMAPDSWMRGEYTSGGTRFHPSFLIGYVAQIPIYLAPFLIAWRGWWKQDRWVFLASGVYWLFPVRAPEASKKIGIETVGMLDRLMPAVARDAVYWFGFLAGLMLLREMLRAARERGGYAMLAACVTAAFLAVMPWSYLYWEKYLLPVLPVIAAHCVLARGRI